VLADDSLDRLIAAADAALLRAKASGRNRVGGEAPLVRPSRVSAQRWERYAPVFADPWFADRIPPYLQHVQSEVRALLETAREGEHRSGVTFRRLRRTAEELDMPGIATLVAHVENAIRDGELARLRPAAEELVQYVMHVQVIYRREPEGRREMPAAPVAQAG